MLIRYTRYKSSGFATFVSGMGAIMINLGIVGLLLMFFNLKGDVVETVTMLCLSIVSLILGALCKYKWADKIAEEAIKKAREAAKQNQVGTLERQQM